MEEEIDALWPLSENYEYTAELGLALRGALPALWAEWQNDYSLPQASGFAFWRHLEERDPETLREMLPSLLRVAPLAMQEEWQASLLPAERYSLEESLPEPPKAVPLWAPPESTTYSEKSAELWSWTKSAFPAIEQQESSPAEEALLQRVHSGTYLRGLEELSQTGAKLTPETEVRPGSWEALLALSGATCQAALWSWKERVPAFIFSVPGSHHAGRSSARGTCLVHHLAVAAEELRRQPGINRVALLDLDAHHGNGSEEIFFYRNDLLTVSVHQANPFFPGTGHQETVGAGRGQGYNINIPLSSRDSWLRGAERALGAVERFSPDIILLQFGGDAHWRDGASDLAATFADFENLAYKLQSMQRPLLVELGASTDPFSWQGSLRALGRGLGF